MSHLYCMDTELGWGNRSYFSFFSQFDRRGASASVLPALEAAVLTLFFLLSSAANVLIFYTLTSNRRLRTVTNYFVCNLTLADICFTLSCPCVAVVRVTGAWTLGNFACKTIVYLSFVCGFVTIWTLTLISVDRYTCIVRNTKRRITPTLALLLIALVWVLTLAAFAPVPLYFVVKECPMGQDTVAICTLGWPRTLGVSVGAVFTSIVCGLGFIVPVIILVVSHISIFVKVHKVHTAMNRQRRFSIQSVTLWSAPGTMTLKGGQPVKSYHPPIAGTLDRTWRRRNRREVQVVRTLVYLVVLFFVMWAPIFIVFVLIMRDGLLDAQQISSHSFLAAMCVAYCNAIINPLAYGLSTDKLRSYLKSVLDCSPLPRRPSLPPAVSNGGACRGVCGGADGCRNGVTSSKLPAKSSETSLS